MTHKIIKRNVFAAGVHLRENTDGTPSRTVEGYAIVFGVPSVPLYDDGTETLREVIAPEAVTRELLDASDIKLTMFHNREIILGRSRNGSGTLAYDIDERGVRFSCELPDTANGNEALSAVRRGDISGCSFAFSCAYSDPQCVTVERSTRADGGTDITATVRAISKIYDFTLAADPAYEQTDVSVREAIAQSQVPAETPAEVPEEESNEQNNLNSPQTMETVEKSVLERTAKSIFEHVRERYGAGLSRMEVRVLTREEAAGSGTTTTTTDNTVTSADVDGGGLMPIQFKGILDPLNQAVVYDKIGMPLSYSNSGQFVWNTYKGGAASFIGEKDTAVAQSLELGKITAEPRRIAVRYDVSRESLYQSAGAVETIVRKAIAMNLSALINLVVCSPTHPTGVPTDIKSPFESATQVTLSKNPTFKELNALKGKLLAKGVDLSGVVFIVSAATYTALEATPTDTGSGIMVLANGKMCGLPVFISDDITDGYVGLGDFSMQPSGFFGDISLIVDPYTRAAENEVRFILNAGFATKTIRQDAFVLGKISAS